MIRIEEVPPEQASGFWEKHWAYLISDLIITHPEDLDYFASPTYRVVLEEHMLRDRDPHHMIYFYKDETFVGATHYTTYQSEDGKCFILDFWILPPYRHQGVGRACFKALEHYTKEGGAVYYLLNSSKESSINFWKSLGFRAHGRDEYGVQLFIKR